MYKSVLVATDGSETAAAVFKHVVQVLDPTGTATLVQVVDDIAQVFARATPAGFEFAMVGLDTDVAQQVVAAQRAEAEAHLAEARQALADAGVQKIETAVLSGIPGDVIVEECGRRGVEIVLMGTHGRSGIRRTVLGSVADHVLRHLRGTPVLLVTARED